MKLRIKFRKYGPVKFIGHLDVMRFFQKTIRRADIDITYSAGYSPHQVMSFAAPLGVGLESNGEYMDIEVNSVTNSQDMIKRLNLASVPGIEIVSVKVLPEGTKNAMASVAAAGYTISFRDGLAPKFDYLSELMNFMAKDSIPYTKTTKKGENILDLKPAIYELKAVDNQIYMLVNASSSGNIKPAMVMEAYLLLHGEELSENALIITREDTYLNQGDEENPIFVPMDIVGEDIA